MPLTLDPVVSVTLEITPVSPVRRDLNLGLIIGDSAHISTTDRVKIYANADEMLTDGFLNTDPEYKAAVLYFSQKPRPQRVAIGVQGVAPETPAQAVTDARAKNAEWYAVAFAKDLTDQEILDVAAYIETTDSVFFYTTSSANVPAGTVGNIFEVMKGLKYRRSHGFYSTDPTKGAVVSIMAYAMTTNFSQANSAYTLNLKSLPGVAVDNLTSVEVATIKNNNGNCYIQRGYTYDVYQFGVNADGSYFDEVHGLDWLKLQIQRNVMDLLTSVRKVPQTDTGVTSIVNAVTAALDGGLRNGLIAPGVWTGPDIGTLTSGTALEKGYFVLAGSVADQSDAERQARIAPPIYAAIKMAGAIHSVVISVLVNR